MHGTVASGSGLKGPVIQHSSVRHLATVSFTAIASCVCKINCCYPILMRGCTYLQKVGRADYRVITY